MPALEIGCGTGRVTSAIEEVASHVVGVDLSLEMLEVGRRSGRLFGKKIATADMRNLPFGGASFGGVYITFGAACYLIDPDDQLSAMSEIGRVLTTDGELVLDLPYRGPGDLELSRPGLLFNNETFGLPGDEKMVYTGAIEVERAAAAMRYRVFVDRYDSQGRLVERRTHASLIALPTLREIVHLVRLAGLRVVDVAGGYDGRAFDDSADRLIVFARLE